MYDLSEWWLKQAKALIADFMSLVYHAVTFCMCRKHRNVLMSPHLGRYAPLDWWTLRPVIDGTRLFIVALVAISNSLITKLSPQLPSESPKKFSSSTNRLAFLTLLPAPSCAFRFPKSLPWLPRLFVLMFYSFLAICEINAHDLSMRWKDDLWV